jgi:uncharacterized repeat protein (TIGR01451 family)
MTHRLPLFAAVLLLGFLTPGAFGQSADVSVTLSGPPTVVAQFGLALLPVTISIKNAGPATADNVVVDFSPGPLPNLDMPYFNCTTVTDHLRCTASHFAPNTTQTTQLIVLDEPADGTVVAISATVSSTTPDPNTANNTNSVTETVVWQSSTRWDGILPLDVVPPGAFVGGGIGIDTGGPSYASDVKVTYAIPEHARFNAAYWPDPFSCVTPPVGSAGDVVCTAKKLFSSTPFIEVDTTIDPATPLGTKLVFKATLACSDAPPLDPLQSVVTVVEPATLVTSLSSPASAEPGSTFANTVTVRNIGPGAAVDTQVQFTVSRGTSITSASAPPGWNCVVFGSPDAHTEALCVMPSFPPGTATFSFPTSVASFAGPRKLTESAIAFSGSDRTGRYGSATATTWIHPEVVPDFDVTIAAPSIIHPGGTVTYKIDVTNTTPNLAFTPSLKLTTIPSTQITSIEWTNCQDAQYNICGLRPAPGGSHQTVFVTLPVVADTASKMTATAEVRGGLFLHDPRASVTSAVLLPADLAVALTATPTALRVGDSVTFTILMTNAGQVTARNATVHIPLPPSLALASATGRCSGGSDVQCLIGALAPGQWSTTTITARPIEPGTISVTASATMDDPDPHTSNNSASVPINVSAALVRRRAAHH